MGVVDGRRERTVRRAGRRRRRPRRRGWAYPGPEFRASPGMRLACTAFLIWWSAVVFTVVLDRWDPVVLVRVATLTILLLVLLLPRLRMAVVATPLGLRVNNGWRERRLRWEDVKAFRTDLCATRARVVAVLQSGEAVTLAATSCGPWSSRHRRGRRILARQQRLAGYRGLLMTDGAPARF